MKAIAYLVSLLFLLAGAIVSFIDLGIGVLLMLVSTTAALVLASEIIKEWNNRE
jgi:hypothetical protein